MEKELYIVSTHVGDEQTMAVNGRRAISNVIYRMIQRGCRKPNLNHHTWTVRRAADATR